MKAKAVSNLLIGGMVWLLLSTAAAAGDPALTFTSGTICKNQLAADAGYIDYVPWGVYSIKNSSTNVVCPLSRDTTNAKGATVYVYIRHDAFQDTQCVFVSQSRTGSILALGTQIWSGSGNGSIVIKIVDGKSSFTSDYYLSCSIPGSAHGFITGIELLEE
ncbi:hypothetical protein [uncultured Thiodictyon sp.]|jgi:hypothetical protein|uniref:hypothetical protein n=1 Tax=uncultured Thiodictyon sp. TaxID=1846217 RepID=UPI0025D064E1|nr:hypothetical protein [uncultured Thiodictyon sp.]